MPAAGMRSAHTMRNVMGSGSFISGSCDAISSLNVTRPELCTRSFFTFSTISCGSRVADGELAGCYDDIGELTGCAEEDELVGWEGDEATGCTVLLGVCGATKAMLSSLS